MKNISLNFEFWWEIETPDLSFCCRHGGSGASYHGVHLDLSAAETKQLKNLKTFSQPLEASCLCLTVPLAEVSPEKEKGKWSEKPKHEKRWQHFLLPMYMEEIKE